MLYVPSLRKAALDKALSIAREQTGLDIDLGDIYLSPFHHSPLTLYYAYKGEADLPLEVNIDSLFVGHRGQDTLLYAHALRLKATAMTSQSNGDLMATPIVVEHLQLDETTLHSDSMIAAVGIDAVIGHLELNSPDLNIAEGKYPLHGLRLNDAFIGIDLRDTPPDTTAQDTTPMLMAFDVPDGEMHNLRFRLTPMNLGISSRTLKTNVLADVGGNKYDARRIDIGRTKFAIGDLSLPIDTFYGNACVDLNHNLITSRGLHVRSDEMDAKADLSTTEMDLATMRVMANADAEYQGSKVRLQATYDIDDEAYDAHVDIEKVNLAAFMPDSKPVVIAGEIDAKGKGLDPTSRAVRSKLNVHLTDAIYDNINVSGMRLNAELADGTVDGNLHLPVAMSGDSMQVSAQTEHQFRVADFMTVEKIRVNYNTQMRDVKAHVAGEDFYTKQLNVSFATGTTTALNLKTDGLDIDVTSPMHVMTLLDKTQPLLNAVNDSAVMTPLTTLADLTMLDTLREQIPAINAKIALRQGSPAQSMLEKMGFDIDRIDLSLHSDSAQTELALEAAIPEIGQTTNAQRPTTNDERPTTDVRLPAAVAALHVAMTNDSTNASFCAHTKLTDGAMALHGLKTDAYLWFDVNRKGNDLNGVGRLATDSISFGGQHFGNSAVNMLLARSETYPNAIRANVQLDDVPLNIVESFIQMEDLDLRGAIRAQAMIDGLPNRFDLSAEVLPIGVAAQYKPYEVELRLGETPIVMQHNHIDFNGLPIYGADSTYLSLKGGLDLDSMRLYRGWRRKYRRHAVLVVSGDVLLVGVDRPP